MKCGDVHKRDETGRGSTEGREWLKNTWLIDNYYRFELIPCQAPKPGLPLKERAFAYAAAGGLDAKIIAMQIILIYISPLAIAAPDFLHHPNAASHAAAPDSQPRTPQPPGNPHDRTSTF
ncbi:MAG TPA: hypothetical protein VH105_12500 [Burkholderiales bacterium]|jgi:hypothetical protein|nr:hypothetical protein [Burkholderiales bacterium]